MKKYLIIGASSGIGHSLAEMLAANGNEVFATFHQNEFESKQNIHAHALDVTTDFELDFLPETLDGLVYCPGSINLKPFHRLKPQDYLADYSLQVVGAIKAIQQCLPKLKKGDNPSIVMFSTVAVQKGFGFHAQVAASKGAIEGLTKSLAAEFAPTIRVNAVAPSLTDTPLAAKILNTDQKRTANAERHPLNRIGQPRDIASMANFLLSEEASWMTGQILHVDGGMSTVK